jgi:quercetin dioxygenase-like cupin family protein
MPAALSAQETPAVDGARVPFACEDQGLRDGAAFGCQLLARPTVTRFPAGPLFWHLARFASRDEAQAAARFTDIVTEITTDAGSETWLHRFGGEGDVPRGGARAALVGPLPLPRASAYRIDVLYAVMPAGARTAAHTHPAPEAWYLLEGAQCVETREGATRTAAGEGGVASRASAPMQHASTGADPLRALLVVIRDPARPRTAPSRWKPKGACDVPADAAPPDSARADTMRVRAPALTSAAGRPRSRP